MQTTASAFGSLSNEALTADILRRNSISTTFFAALSDYSQSLVAGGLRGTVKLSDRQSRALLALARELEAVITEHSERNPLPLSFSNPAVWKAVLEQRRELQQHQ